MPIFSDLVSIGVIWSLPEIIRPMLKVSFFFFFKYYLKLLFLSLIAIFLA